MQRISALTDMAEVLKSLNRYRRLPVSYVARQAAYYQELLQAA